MGRPRLAVDETAIITAYEDVATILGLARTHSVDRYVVRRVLDNHYGPDRDTNGPRVLTLPSNHPGKHLPDDHISGPDLCDRAGITYRQLDYWTRVGYLHPLDPTPGSGRLRAFPIAELSLARLVRDLLAAGLMPKPAFALAEQLLEHGHTVLAGIRIDLPQDL